MDSMIGGLIRVGGSVAKWDWWWGHASKVREA